MSNDTQLKTKEDERREYTALIEHMATGIYHCLPKAGFTQQTLTELATSSHKNVKWEQLPGRVRLCLVKLAMAMMPKAAAEAASEEQKKEEKEGNAPKKDGADAATT